MAQESIAIQETRKDVREAALVVQEAADALERALGRLQEVLTPHTQTDEMLLGAIGLGSSGNQREVEANQRLLADLRFDQELAVRIEEHADQLARIAGNIF